MTRIYNPDFPCSVCRLPGSMGWLYRCTQDMELLIEEDLEDGIPLGVNKLSSLLPDSKAPQKRSPAACASNDLAWFEETSEANRESYTPDQISTIVKQRAHVLGVIKETQVKKNDPSHACLGLHPLLSNGESSPTFSPRADKSWVPSRECQYHCCHWCRPSLIERSFLSLDAVVNGEPPATAVIGFGFEYFGGRPVSLVKHVRNLGLRPNPTRRSSITTSEGSASISTTQPSTSDQASGVMRIAAATPFDEDAGVGNTAGQPRNARDSAAVIRDLNIKSTEAIIGDGSAYGPTVHTVFGAMAATRQGSSKVAPSDLNQIPAIVIDTPRRERARGGTDSSAARFGPEGRLLNSRRSTTNLRSRFNVDELQGDGGNEMGESLLPDNALDGAVSLPNPRAVSLDEETVDSGNLETIPENFVFQDS